MKLPIPSQIIGDAKVQPDTLATLDVGTLNGTSPFVSGQGFLIFEDGPSQITKSFNFRSSKEEISYLRIGPTLFRGAFTFDEAFLSPQFRVPKDITYSDNPAKVRFSITSNTGEEAVGAVGKIQLTLGSPSNDTDGPIITFESKSGRILRSGDHLSSEKKLIIRISDPLGINLTGEKGHELLFINPTMDDKSIVTERFIYDVNSLNTGTIEYNIPSEDNQLSLVVSAWDNANNPAELTIKLYITDDQGLRLFNVFNFPNPFSSQTQFSFEISSTAEISVDIYTLGGSNILHINPQSVNAGYNFINWDGRDKYGDILANGVYLYSVKAINGNESVSTIGKIAKYQ